ncbi:MAG: hypothetical protein D6706_08530 [Chloroflexi bacterium]|nr:MAG: hypothetical protein D6706_08530 [Chloroflexota bacterium]
MNEKRGKRYIVGAILVIAFAGYVVGGAMSVFGVVLAPPNTNLTFPLLYLPVSCLGVPVGIVALLTKRIKVQHLFIALVVMVLGFVVYLTFLGPSLPGGMTNCQLMDSSSATVQYTCVATSSDNPSYRREFIVKGRSGWPVMRQIPVQP